MKNTKIPHCLNISIIHYKNHGNRQEYNTQIQEGTISRLGTGTSIKSGGVKLILWAQCHSLKVQIYSITCFGVQCTNMSPNI